MKTSVIICAYNYARFLPQCLESVLTQARRADEVIVVDDGSTDDTPSVVKEFPAVRYIRQERSGKATAFNRGFAASSGDVICHLDADDYWLPTKLERALEVLSRSEVGGVTHDAIYVDGANKYLYGSEESSSNGGSAQIYWLRDVLLRCFIYKPRNTSAGSLGVVNTICVRRRAVADCFPLPEDLGLAVDGALLLSASRSRVAFLPEKLAAYRHHGNNSFVSDPRSLDFQHRLFEWLLTIPEVTGGIDRRLLRALMIETAAHSAVHNRRRSWKIVYSAATLAPSLLQLGLIPHWKHWGLPVASLLDWRKMRDVVPSTKVA